MDMDVSISISVIKSWSANHHNISGVPPAQPSNGFLIHTPSLDKHGKAKSSMSLLPSTPIHPYLEIEGLKNVMIQGTLLGKVIDIERRISLTFYISVNS